MNLYFTRCNFLLF